MHRALSLVRRALVTIGQFETALAAAILIGIVAMIVAQVALDTGLGVPITWEQEAGAYALVWMTFLGASVALKQMRHVTIVSFVGQLPLRARALVRAVVFGVMLWTFSAMMRELPSIMIIEGRSTTVALPLSLPRSWFFSVPLWTSCLLLSLTTLLYFVEALLATLRSDTDRPDTFPVMGGASQ